MNLVNTLIQGYFAVSAGELVIGGVPATSLAAKYGTPLFVYDREIIDRKLTLLRNTLPAEFTISYSVKANPNRAILQHFLARGCGLEVASGGEFCRALEAGCAADNILFAGPGKTEAELEYVLTHNIGEIHIESLVEAQRISAICRRLGRSARVALRVNPGGEVQGGAMRMGGKPAPFGVDEEQLPEVLDRLLDEPGLEVGGIHLFTGTQILDHKVLAHQYQRGLAIAKRVATRLKRSLHTVDFGGGLGIPYFNHEHDLDMACLGESLAAMMVEVRNESCFSGTQFVLEPGRYLVGEAGIYIARVNDIKVSRGKKFLILDGGMNHHLAASGNLGQVIKRNFPVAILNKLDKTVLETVDVAGPLCTPLDVLAREVALPSADVGDLICIFQSGAYGLTASPVDFLCHPVPAEVWIDCRKTNLIRQRGTYTNCDIPTESRKTLKSDAWPG
jgi:diaminopimelate decarboxylase